MFHLNLTPNITKVFEGFCILKRSKEIKCIYSFPNDYSFEQYYELIFPCNCVKEKSEEYCIVTSNKNNDRSFLLCRYVQRHQIYLCIFSHNPWFEIFSKMLLNFSHDDFMPNNYKRICSYLKEVNKMTASTHIILPSCNGNDNTPQVILKGSLHYPYIYDKYIQEYLTAIDPSSSYRKKLWLQIFWSMLLERPIIFMSKRYQKLTSSLLAATFFIHPLSWLHKFVSIIPQKNPQLLGMNCCMLGIHNCMEPFIAKTDFWNEALLVDLDKGISSMVGASDNKKETQSRFKIPKFIKNFFISRIEMVDESVSSNSHPKIEGLISNTPWFMNKEETMYNDYKKGFHMYSLLFRTLVSMLIGNYRQFIHFYNGHYEFDREKFISSNSKLSSFLKILVQSQCFDSFIDEKVKCLENGCDMDDRFDRERQEFPLINNVKYKERKIFRIRPLTGYHLKHSKTIDRVEKVKTMPNLKKICNKKLSQSTFHLATSSLSSSTSSIVSNQSLDNLDDLLSIKNESFHDQIMKGLIDRRIILDRNFSDDLSVISKNTLEEEDDVLLTPICTKNRTFQLNSVLTKPSKSNDPMTFPSFIKSKVRSEEVPKIVHQKNHSNLEGNLVNNNIHKSVQKAKIKDISLNIKPLSKNSSH